MRVRFRLSKRGKAGVVHLVLEPGRTWCGEMYSARDQELDQPGEVECRNCTRVYGKVVHLFPREEYRREFYSDRFGILPKFGR